MKRFIAMAVAGLFLVSLPGPVWAQKEVEPPPVPPMLEGGKPLQSPETKEPAAPKKLEEEKAKPKGKAQASKKKGDAKKQDSKKKSQASQAANKKKGKASSSKKKAPAAEPKQAGPDEG